MRVCCGFIYILYVCIAALSLNCAMHRLHTLMGYELYTQVIIACYAHTALLFRMKIFDAGKLIHTPSSAVLERATSFSADSPTLMRRLLLPLWRGECACVYVCVCGSGELAEIVTPTYAKRQHIPHVHALIRPRLQPASISAILFCKVWFLGR